ncbi:hypothetical protein BN1051_03052 [Arthrobacter saudimassiliensis]|uniref:Uncharacterized protein n=1 Tax=Arthrobacter saudimassiliensis TaxID=1461584 RepID=A0A078MTM3_9MICC|nr:hypothetical protein BN1051_03052 [Arthrobacter saudimassiliensis]
MGETVESVVNIFEILAAVATIGALLYLAKQTKASTASMQHSQELTNIEMQREERALQEAAQVHASQIACWPVIRHSDAGKAWGVEIRNSSNTSVYDLQITRDAGVAASKAKIPKLENRAAVLAPGRYFAGGGQYLEVLSDEHVTHPIVGNGDYAASLTFTDANGQRWVRDKLGSLQQATVVPQG